MKLTETEKQELIVKILELIEEYPNSSLSENGHEHTLTKIDYYYPNVLKSTYKRMFLKELITPIVIRRAYNERCDSLLKIVRVIETKRQAENNKDKNE